MNQIFHPSMNVISRVSIIGGILLVLGLLGVINVVAQSPYMSEVQVAKEQPVPFSHLHHVRQLGIECRYCHTSVENAAYAGIPATETCMSCHSQIWTEAPMLEPVRNSWETGEPIAWNKVHDLSDFVYFNHSIHVNKGFGCESCHGEVPNMHLAYKAETLHMEWCLNCHRNPEDFIRPVTEIYNFEWQEETEFLIPAPVHEEEGEGEGHGEEEHSTFVQAIDGHELVEEYGIEVGRLDNCSICHR